MYKLSYFPGVDPKTGEALVQVIKPGEASLEKLSQAIHPKLRAYLAKLKPEPDKVYVLCIALGASEYYGQNINGDIFPESALAHVGHDYGYQSFLDGHAFKHHQNKNPEVSFGSIELSIWNDSMKRVELVLALDKNRAKQFDAQDVTDKIEAGIPCSVSMGCKVPYDICSICSNRAKTRADYCFHLLNEMNKIYEDGRQAGAINTMPRFFDISFVFIGADRIAKTICKIASGGCCELCSTISGKVDEQDSKHADAKPTPKALVKEHTKLVKVLRSPSHTDDIREAAKQEKELKEYKKSASVGKIGDIFKEVPSSFVSKTVPALESSEPTLPRNILDDMATKYPLGQSLGTTAAMGMPLKPQEFQRIVLIRLGQKNLADELDSKGECFGPSQNTDESLPMGGTSGELLSRLLPFLKERSGFGPILKIRITRITVEPTKQASPSVISKRVFLDKIAEGYNGYRLRLLTQMPNELPTTLDQHPELAAELFRENFLDTFTKEAADLKNSGPLKVLLGVFPILYFLSAHWKDQEVHGQRLGFVKKFVAEHPELSSLLLAGAAAQVMNQKVPA
jgi:hypothetical protein